MLIFYYYNNNDKEVSVFVESESFSESRFLLVFTRCFVIVLLHERESPKTSIHEIKFLAANMLKNNNSRSKVVVSLDLATKCYFNVCGVRLDYWYRTAANVDVTCEPKEASSHAL